MLIMASIKFELFLLLIVVLNCGVIGAQSNCPEDFEKDLVQQMNINRHVNGHSPVALSKALSKEAARNVPNRHFGRLKGEWNMERNKIEGVRIFKKLTKLDLVEQRWQWCTIIEPPLGWPKYTEKSWAQTTQMGVACSIEKVDYAVWVKVRVAVLFDYPPAQVTIRPPFPPTPCPICPTPSPCPPPITCRPQVTTTRRHVTSTPTPTPSSLVKFTVPAKQCPSVFTKSILRQLNTQRRTQNLSPLTLSPSITSDAQEWAELGKYLNDQPNMDKYGQLNWRQLWDSSLVDHFVVNPEDPFQQKWGLKALPFYTANGARRQYTSNEWQATKEVGIACWMDKLEAKSDSEMDGFVVLHLAVFFRYNGRGGGH